MMFMFGDISYVIRNGYWHVNNKIKRKLTLFREYHQIFTLCIEKIQILTRENTDVFITLDEDIHVYGIHNKRVNILYIIAPNEALFSTKHCWDISNCSTKMYIVAMVLIEMPQYLSEELLMNNHNIHFPEKIRKKILIPFLSGAMNMLFWLTSSTLANPLIPKSYAEGYFFLFLL